MVVEGIIDSITGFVTTDWFILILILGMFITIYREAGMENYLSIILGTVTGMIVTLFMETVSTGMTLLAMIFLLFGIVLKKRYEGGFNK